MKDVKWVLGELFCCHYLRGAKDGAREAEASRGYRTATI